MTKLAIIGAGITGVTSAYALARRGFKVTVIDRHRYPAMETSFANGGQLSASNAEVWNQPSTIVKGLKWMLRGDAPLLVNPAPTWHRLSWFAQFMANIPSYERNTVKTVQLAIEARRHLYAWAEEEVIDFDLKHRGILHVYADKAGFKHAASVTEMLRKGGLERRAVTPAEMRAIEPALQGSYYGGFYTESDSTGDIHKYTVGLAAAAARLGVTFQHGRTVDSIAKACGEWQLCGLDDGQPWDAAFDAVVICAGTASRALASSVGDALNVYPVKGYSITVNLNDEASRSGAPEVSLLDDGAKIVTSRLGDDRFRVAGTAEFNGFNYNIRADRIRPLVEWVQKCFPQISTRSVVPWAGLRPMMPDMLPRVGPGRAEGIFYNTGHGHLGWTLSAATAELVADSVTSKLRPVSGIHVGAATQSAATN